MTTRILPVDEWPRLEGTEAATIWPMLDPVRARVIVVEVEDEIVGCVVLAPVVHAECLWIAPEHRKRAGVARMLLREIETHALEMGTRNVMGAWADEEMGGYLARLPGVSVPAEFRVLRFWGGH